MSGPSSAGAGSDGVTRNSALSFLAQAQVSPQGQAEELPPPEPPGVPAASAGEPGMPPPEALVPAGVRALLAACTEVYPDQPNPLQVTTRLKYWLGGHDPLDYISMYYHRGDEAQGVPPHWHYISFGLSDLHGDGRVHAPSTPESGLGAELTFRLLAPTPTSGPSGGPPMTPAPPPLWPAALLQALARYVFTTGNKFFAGDHISWHAALDGSGDSRLRHLLVAPEPRLQPRETPHGSLHFLQIVGCTGRELRAAQRGSGFDVLRALQNDPRCGGPYLISDPRRRRSARLPSRGGRAPAPLAGVSAPVAWEGELEPAAPAQLSEQLQEEIKQTLRRGLSSMERGAADLEGHMSTDSFEMSSMERALPPLDDMEGSWRSSQVQYFSRVHLIFTPEGASLLPLAICGRVQHARHFTWRGVRGACGGGGGGGGARSLTLVHERVQHALPTASRPYAARGSWLQVLIPEDLASDMATKFHPLSSLAACDSESGSEAEGNEENARPVLPLRFSWPERGLEISIVSDT